MTQEQPSQIGNYRILRTLGEGAMARVYLAEMIAAGGFRRKCALKVVHPEFARDHKFIELMQREARLGALLEHPNIVNTISHGDVDGVHFIDLEYVEGKTLAEFLEMMHKKGKSGLEIGFCLQIVLPILRGLDYAHNFTDDAWEGPPGMIHRDLKPANVMLSNQAVVKIMDFGIAKARASRSNLTSIGQVRGTPVYMAPEQVTGKGVDGRSDQFAAASVFYELVTGKRLFSGLNLISVMQTVATADTTEAEALLDKSCAGLGKVLSRMWEREPDDRFETCWDAADALAKVLKSFLEEPMPRKPRKTRQRSAAARSRKQKAAKSKPGMFGLLSALTGRSSRKSRKRPAPETGGRRQKRRKKSQREEVASTKLSLESAEDWSAASALLESTEYHDDPGQSAPEQEHERAATPAEVEEFQEALAQESDGLEDAIESGRTISMLFMDVIFEDEQGGSSEPVDLDEITTLRGQPVVTGTVSPMQTTEQLTNPDRPVIDNRDAATQAPVDGGSTIEESLAAAALEPATVIGEFGVEVNNTEDLPEAQRGKAGGKVIALSDTLDLNPLARPHEQGAAHEPITQTQDGAPVDEFFGADPNKAEKTPSPRSSTGSGEDPNDDSEEDFFGGMEEDDGDADEDLDDLFSQEFET